MLITEPHTLGGADFRLEPLYLAPFVKTYDDLCFVILNLKEWCIPLLYAKYNWEMISGFKDMSKIGFCYMTLW
jgi:hypothetical protein